MSRVRNNTRAMQMMRSVGMKASSVTFLTGSSLPPSSMFYSLFNMWLFP
jgi:hypothetical protein